VEEITEYGLTLSPPFLDAERFIDHYTANGWTVGRASMSDWQAVVRNWQRNDIKAPSPNPTTRKALPQPPLSDVDLQAIVQAYPRRQDDAEAMECIRASIRQGNDPDVILAGTRAIAAIIPQLPSGHLNAFVVSAGSFFRKEKWRDDPQTWLRNAGSKNGAMPKPLNLGGRRPGPPIESFSEPDFFNPHP